MTLSLEDHLQQQQYLAQIVDAGDDAAHLIALMHHLIEHVHENTHKALSPIHTLTQMGLESLIPEIMQQHIEDNDLAAGMATQIEVMLPLLSAIQQRLRASNAKDNTND